MDLVMNSPSSTTTTDQDVVEVIDDLLEECWFYDNLLNRRSRLLRYCHSDPFPTSSSSSPSPKPESSEKPANLASEKVLEPSRGRCLARAPSLPPCRGEGDIGEAAKKIKKLTRQLSERVRVQEPTPPGSHRFLRNKEVARGSNPLCLQRTRTLPSRVGEFQDQESEARLGFLIREALASSSGPTPPSTQSLPPPKVSSIPRPPRNSRSEECIRAVIVRPPNPSRKTLRKSVSNIERVKEDEIMMGSSSNSPSSDMKAQLKFWARAVATNVRQEC